ncbi:hypothetical protein N7508_005874 [Penicillium antarcticum]|uniref:uncharacterized protein n=1 Tax=Penicillium antarcticum TaxID=416450 RepID=UPI00238CF365|nr:uncharacterized protein N7508_005874 [Penicillium antarcticum]KAJ5306859.1 hypothetical protein N7508_005874 [Penicillium antarcticum]
MPTETTSPVCVNCKLRKKKCDKARPRCGYCARKNLTCQSSIDAKYSQLRRLPMISSPVISSSLLLAETLSAVLQDEPTSLHSTVYLQILRIIRLTDQTIDEICLRYFRGMHSFIPILSAPRFHEQLIHSAALPSATFSVLLLSMALVTYHPSLVTSSSAVDQATLYFTVKSLYSQTLASFPDSLHLVQAGTIIASYEYATRRIHEAFFSISVCARMGYTIGLHLLSLTGRSDNPSQATEKSDTWWGVVITERTILSEAEVQQPVLSRFAEGQVSLPREPVSLEWDSDLFNDIVSKRCPNVEDCDGLARVTQAIWLLDQVFKASEERDVTVRLAQLDKLDYSLRGCLALTMDQSQGRWGLFCTANAIIFRALFILHRKVIHSAAGVSCLSSHIALETTIQMVNDIATTQQNMTLAEMDTLPPSRAFVFRAALHYLDEFGTDCGRWDTVRTCLESSITMFDARWNAVCPREIPL